MRFLPFEPRDVFVLPHAKFLPARHRIVLVQHARAIDKVFVLAQAHLGILRQRLGGEQRHHPAQGALGAAAHHRLRHFAARGRHQRHPLRIDIGQRFGVDIALDGNAHVEFVDGHLLERIEVLNLLFRAVLQHQFQRARHQIEVMITAARRDVRQAAALDDLLDDRQRQRLCHGRRRDVHSIARLDLGRVFGDDLRQFKNS